MKFIITTHNNCLLYDYEARKILKNLRRPTKGINWSYGVSWHKDKLFIAWREAHEILEYDKDLKPTGRAIKSCDAHPIGDMHQITCYDGKIWVANTGYNRISIFDAETLKLVEEWYPDKGHNDGEPIYNPNKVPTHVNNYYKHFNSIMFNGDGIYVLAHMTIHNPPSKVWQFTSDKKLMRKIKGGKQAHNIFFLNDKLTVCDSDNHCLLQPESGKVIFRSMRGAWLRGASMPPDLLVIGRSDVCRDKARRNKALGGLIFFKDRNLGKPETIWLGKGPVEEIRCLDAPDEAHPQPPFWDKS